MSRWIAGVFIVAGCGGDKADPGPTDPPGTDTLVYEIFSTTRWLENDVLERLHPIDPVDSKGTLAFDSVPGMLADVQVGTVLLAGESQSTPDGLLRVVSRVDRQGEKLTLETQTAPLALAFRKLHVKLNKRAVHDLGGLAWTDRTSRPLRTDHPSIALQAITVNQSKKLQIVVFDGDADTATTHDQVRVDGELGGGFDYIFGLDTDWGDVLELPSAVKDCVVSAVTGGGCAVEDLLPEVKVGFDVNASIHANATLSGAAFKGFSGTFDVANIDLPKFVVGPLVFLPSVEVKGSVEGSASSQFSVGTRAEAGFGTAVAYSSKTGGKIIPPTLTKAFEATSTEVVLYAEGKASIGAELVLRLYGVLGPKAGISAYSKVVADPLKTPCWNLAAGVDATYGFTIGTNLPLIGAVTLASFTHNLSLAEAPIASGACSLPAGSDVPLPPGQGPTAAALANPSFLPWAATFAQPTVGFPYTTANGLRWVDAKRTIDGNFVVASSESHTLFKMSENGELVWAKAYGMFPDEPTIPKLRVLRTLATADAHLFVVTYPFGIIKVGQAGGPVWGVSYDVPRSDDTGPFGDAFTQQTFVDAVEDGTGGLWLAAAYGRTAALDRVGVWLLRIGPDGKVLQSARFEDATRDLYPTLLLRRGGGLLVAGFLWDQTAIERNGFLLGLDAAFEVDFTRSLKSCGGNEQMIPTAGIVDRMGDFVLTGHGGQYDRSFVLKLKASDGAVGFFATPWTGSALKYMVSYGIAALPTTGYLLSGRYQDNSPEWFLSSVDAVGNVLWSKRYRLNASGPQASESSWAGVQLTDDGGGLMVGLTNQPTAGLGSVWAMKLPAKDGAIAFTEDTAAMEPFAAENAECPLEAVPFDVIRTAYPVLPSTRTVQVKTAPLVVSRQK